MAIRDLIPWKKNQGSLLGPQDFERDPVRLLQREMNRLFNDFFAPWAEYGSPQCYKLEPTIEAFVKKEGDRILFKRVPVAFQDRSFCFLVNYFLLAKAALDLKQVCRHPARADSNYRPQLVRVPLGSSSSL
jgi:hypothetical protein